MNAVLFGRILMGVLGVLVLGIGVGFVNLTSMLDGKVTETDRARIEADSVAFEIQKLTKLKADLERQQDVVTRAQEIVADSKTYQYQNQIVEDITAYAQQSGIAISGFDFATSASGAPPTSAPPSGSAAPPAANVNTKIAATVSLQSPLPYDNLLKFMRLIEGNLTKIQLTNVSITPEGKDPRLVNNPSVGIEVFVRK